MTIFNNTNSIGGKRRGNIWINENGGGGFKPFNLKFGIYKVLGTMPFLRYKVYKNGVLIDGDGDEYVLNNGVLDPLKREWEIDQTILNAGGLPYVFYKKATYTSGGDPLYDRRAFIYNDISPARTDGFNSINCSFTRREDLTLTNLTTSGSYDGAQILYLWGQCWFSSLTNNYDPSIRQIYPQFTLTMHKLIQFSTVGGYDTTPLTLWTAETSTEHPEYTSKIIEAKCINKNNTYFVGDRNNTYKEGSNIYQVEDVDISLKAQNGTDEVEVILYNLLLPNWFLTKDS